MRRVAATWQMTFASESRLRSVGVLLLAVICLCSGSCAEESEWLWFDVDRCLMVFREERFGFIGMDGLLRIPPRYVVASDPCEGFVFVWRNRNKGLTGNFINPEGREISPVPLGDPYEGQSVRPTLRFEDGVAWVRTGEDEYAFIDQGGRVIHQATADQGWFPSRGLMAVRIGGKTGFCDADGSIVIPAEFDEVRPFSSKDQRFTEIRIGEHWGAIDRKGQSVLPPCYDEARLFTSDPPRWIVRREGMWGLAASGAVEAVPCRFDAVAYAEGRVFCMCEAGVGWRVHDPVTLRASREVYDAVGGSPDVVGHAPQSLYGVGDGVLAAAHGAEWGFATFAGEWVIEPRFDQISGWGPRQLRGFLVREDGLKGFVTASGRVLLEPRFLSVTVDSSGVAVVVQRGLEGRSSGMVDVRSGRWILGPHVDCAHVLGRRGDWTSVRQDNSWGLVGTHTGRWILPPEYSDEVRAYGSEKGSLAAVKLGSRWGLIDTATGDTILQPRFEGYQAWAREGDERRIYRWRDSGILTLVDEEGRFLLDESHGVTRIVERTSDMRLGHGPVETAEGKGLISDEAEIVISCRFEDIGYLSEGLASASRDGRWGYINRDEEWVVEPGFEAAQSFSEGYAAVRIGDLWGYIDRDGTVVIEPAFAEAGACFRGRMPVAAVDPGATEGPRQRWGIIDLAGKVVLPLEYDAVEWPDALRPGYTVLHGTIGSDAPR